jgi:hypothetical protein
LARVAIDYTDPFIDQSLTIEANEKANVSYPQQTADSVDATTYKYACLDGTWDLTTGEYHLAPSADQLTQQQFGWWGAQFADQDGYFASPYPTLTVRHLPRPIRQLKVVGDTAREEYPVDFTVKLYGPDDTLLKTETVTGNDQVSWSKTLEPQVLDVAKQELTITRWSLPGTCAKIIEFFTSVREVYETGDLVSVRLLEEREASQGSLPVGNISSNEITLALSNADKKFDLDNENSPLKNLLKPNRRIRAWLGAEAENIDSDNPPTFTRNSVAYLSDGTQVAANQPRFEQGKFGKAIMVEEGTTNGIQNGNFATGTFAGWSDWSKGGNKSIVEHDGLKFARIEHPASDEGYSFGIQSTKGISVVEGDKVTLSFVFKGDIPNYAYLMLAPSPHVYITSSILYTDLGNGWKRGTYTWTADRNCSVGFMFAYAGTGNYVGEFSLAQLEKKPYPTSFTDGTRAAERLTIPTEGVLNPQEGTVEFYHLFRSDSEPVPWLVGSSLSGFTQFLAVAKANANTLRFRTRNTSETMISTIDAPITDGWHYIAARWSSAEITLFIDGQKVGAVPNPYLPTQLASIIAIGYNHVSNTQYCNSLIDDLRISSRARTDEEILAAYQSNKPLQRDEDTTYLLTFNGSIYPVEMCWVPLGTFWSLDWDSPDDTLEATVTARDRMELLRKGTYQTSQVQQNKSLYELAEAVLQDAGLTSDEYIIDTDLQNIIIPYAWFNPVSHREALRRIAEAGLAAAFQNRDGKIQIESFLISGDEPVLEITEDDYFPPLRAPSRQDQVANEIIVDTQPLRPASAAEEVYRSNEPITIPGSSTKTITAFYNKTPVIEAVASLDNPPAGVSITEATYYGWGASVKIQNTNATDKQATLVIQGKPLTIQNKERAIARDETSITENGVLRYEFPANPLVQTLAQAQAIADTLLASVKDPRRDIEVDWRGNPALLLGDRVTVKGKDYHVIRQEISWAGYMQAKLTGRKAE